MKIPRRTLLTVMLLTGFVSFGYEVLLQSEAVVLLGSSSVSMGIIISTFILGYLSSYAFGRWVDRIDSVRRLGLMFCAIEISIFLLLITLQPTIRLLPRVAFFVRLLPPFLWLSPYWSILTTLAVMALIAPMLMGAEIPVVIKLLSSESPDEAHERIGTLTGTVFLFDSLGAGIGGLVTSIILLPLLGKMMTGVLLGAICLSAALLMFVALQGYTVAPRVPPIASRWSGRMRHLVRERKGGLVAASVLVFILIAVALNVSVIENAALQSSPQYEGTVVFHTQSRYQEIVVTDHDVLGRTLYLDGQLQTSAGDEYQYHEMLVHVAMAAHPDPQRVFIIGGGDGGTVEEVLKYPVSQVVMVELDPEVPEVSREWLPTVSGSAFSDDRLDLIFTDGRLFAEDYEAEPFDIIIADLPDPETEAVALLFTQEFYGVIEGLLAPGGVFVTQAGSYFEVPHVTASILVTAASVFTHADLYGSMVWSYGPWAFVVASNDLVVTDPEAADLDLAISERLGTDPDLRLYSGPFHHAAFALVETPDMERAEAEAQGSTEDHLVIQQRWY